MEDLSVFDKLQVMKGLIHSYRNDSYVPGKTLKKLVEKKRKAIARDRENRPRNSILMSPKELDRSYREFVKNRNSRGSLKTKQPKRYSEQWKKQLMAKLDSYRRQTDSDDPSSNLDESSQSQSE